MVAPTDNRNHGARRCVADGIRRSDDDQDPRMRAAIAVALLAVPLVVGGCGRKDDPTSTAAPSGFVPPEARAPTPIPGLAQTTPITAYVGKYPHDAIAGVDFYDRTDVATGLVHAVGDAKLRETIRGRSGPATPIFKLGTRVAAWGCEEHNCGDHNWAVLIDPKDGKTQVCHHDAATMGQGSDWYAGAAPARRAQSCPSQG
jgi:hypothetical protein